MKKITFVGMAALLLGISTINTGCMGSWALTKKVYNWNDGAFGNKFLDNGLFWIFSGVGVYGVTLFIDGIANFIEFWSGSNPLAMKPGERETQVVIGKDGNKYEMTATLNHMQIVALSGKNKGETTLLTYHPETTSWSQKVNQGEDKTFAIIHNDINKVELIGADGSLHLRDMQPAFASAE